MNWVHFWLAYLLGVATPLALEAFLIYQMID